MKRIQEYPDIAWVRKTLRYGMLRATVRERVLGAFIIGSEARGLAKSGSDLDIAVIIPEKKRVSSLNFTVRFHSKFMSNEEMPKWNGRRVDFQFFYPSDGKLNEYAKIKLKGR